MRPTPAIALRLQRIEATQHAIYLALAARETGENRRILQSIAKDEARHYAFWQKHTGRDCKPNKLAVWWYVLLAKIFGMTFVLQLFEIKEAGAQDDYNRYDVAGIKAVIADENRHEKEEQKLIAKLKDQRLEYAGSIVLGLNDGLVELTGVLAGLTFALPKASTVVVAGLVTGIAAAMSMAASGYFAAKEEKGKNPLVAALYVGVAYLFVVMLLISPYLLLANIHLALAVTLTLAVLLIIGYTSYIAVAKRAPFWPRFLEMVAISLSVAAISFLLGNVLNKAFGI
jgi:VIT1/CCC1 family predicted Fe2+/Mn2+ transporter